MNGDRPISDSNLNPEETEALLSRSDASIAEVLVAGAGGQRFALVDECRVWMVVVPWGRNALGEAPGAGGEDEEAGI